MSELALDSFQSLSPEEIDSMAEEKGPKRKLIHQNRLLMPRTEVLRIAINKTRRRFRVLIWRLGCQKAEIKNVPLDINLVARYCNRFKPKEIIFNGDSVIPKIDFDWVNGADKVEIYNAKDRQNINMFLEKCTHSDMDFHSIYPVTADEVLRSMTCVTSFRYVCGSGGRLIDKISKETLKLISEKSNLGSGIRHITLYNRLEDEIIEPRDITDFLKNAKFESHGITENGTHKPRVIIDNLFATRKEFTDHLAAEGFRFLVVKYDILKVFVNDNPVLFVCGFTE